MIIRLIIQRSDIWSLVFAALREDEKIQNKGIHPIARLYNDSLACGRKCSWWKLGHVVPLRIICSFCVISKSDHSKRHEWMDSPAHHLYFWTLFCEFSLSRRKII